MSAWTWDDETHLMERINAWAAGEFSFDEKTTNQLKQLKETAFRLETAYMDANTDERAQEIAHEMYSLHTEFESIFKTALAESARERLGKKLENYRESVREWILEQTPNYTPKDLANEAKEEYRAGLCDGSIPRPKPDIIKNEDGNFFVEYSLISALIAIICIAVLQSVGHQVSAEFSLVSTNL